MPNPERSARDRQGRAEILRDTCANFVPTFAPPDVSLNVTNFTTFLGTVDVANTAVETFEGSYTTASNNRVTLVKLIKTTGTQALGYLKSNKVWKANHAAAKKALDNLRGVVAPKKEPPPGTTPPAKRNQGKQAYGEIAAHWGKFVNACIGAAGYSPPATEITASTLSGHLSAIKSLNDGINNLSADITLAQKQRGILYDEPEEGLADKFQAIKEAVKGQYGFASAEYAAVKGIKW